jgi:hypothetical protein
VACHADPTKLDLRASFGGSGRMVSYDELLLGDPLIGANGQPQTRIEDGVPVIVRGPALVEPMTNNAMGIARSSRLTEIMFGENLKAEDAARTAHPQPPFSAPNHAAMLNAAEKRLITEWMDLGGQYMNDPSRAPNVRRVQALSEQRFEQAVLPVLTSQCLACHQPGQPQGVRNRFILTGNAEGDYNVSLTMVGDTCNPANNPLLRRPSTVPHPSGALTQTAPLLAPGSAGYTAIADWIRAGCGQ